MMLVLYLLYLSLLHFIQSSSLHVNVLSDILLVVAVRQALTSIQADGKKRKAQRPGKDSRKKMRAGRQ